MTREEATKKAQSLKNLIGKTFDKEKNRLLEPPNDIMKFGYKKNAKTGSYEVWIKYFDSNAQAIFDESYDDFLKNHHL